MKKIILLLIFYPIIVSSQVSSLDGYNEDIPYYTNYTIQDVLKRFNEEKLNSDYGHNTNLTDSSFQYSLDFGNNSSVYPFEYYFGFNDNGNITYTQTYHPAGGYQGRSINQIYDEVSLRYRQYDNNPKKSNKISKHKEIDLQDSIEFRISNRGQNSTVTISKYVVPQYNRRRTKITGYRGGVVERIYPDKVAVPVEVNTKFSDLFDLRDEEMIYNIKNYMTAFRLHITSPEIFIGNVYINDLTSDPKNAVKNSNKWKLNAIDKHLLEKFSTNHKFNCEFNLERTAKYGHPNDKSKENQIVCPSDFSSYEMKVEYRDLEDNIIAVAVGNVFDNGIMHVIIDPIKFKEASPAKRAFIMWHELFHTVGLDHGECGPLMFPYTDKDYTWEDWEASNGEAMKCFISKRNALQGIF